MLRWDSRRADKNEQKTLNYLQSSTRSSCLKALDAALAQLLKGVKHVNRVFSQHATVDSSGKLVWQRSSFIRHMGRRLPPDITTYASLLWHMFLTAAYYPFVPEPIDCDDDATLDLTAFRRAFAFLVLNGWDLYGLKQDGSYIKNCGERVQPIRLSQKVPRLARIIFRCLVTYSSASQDMERSQDDSRFQDIKDTLLFTQPLLKRTIEAPKDLTEEYDAATIRLLDEEHSRFSTDLAPDLLRAEHLQNLVQLLLLLRPGKNFWRKALTLRNTSTVRSSEARYCGFEAGVDELAQASDCASAIIRAQFGSEVKRVSLEMLTEWCQTCPFFILGFRQLWAALLAPENPTELLEQASTSLPTTIANMLCYGSGASFLQEARQDRLSLHEWQLQYHLQHSVLVASLRMRRDLHSLERKLDMILADRTSFHMLVIRYVDSALTSDEERSWSLATLISPLVQRPGHQRVSYPGEDGLEIAYIRRAWVVRLRPEFSVMSYGGIEAYRGEEGLTLRWHDAVNGTETSVIIRLQDRFVGFANAKTAEDGLRFSIKSAEITRSPRSSSRGDGDRLGQDNSPSSSLHIRDLKLIDVDCYRLPPLVSDATPSSS